MNEQPQQPPQASPPTPPSQPVQPAPEPVPQEPQPLYQSTAQPSQATPSAYEGYDTQGQNSVAAQPDDTDASEEPDSITWQASEYVHHGKGIGWLLGLVGIVAVFVGIAVWLQAWTFVALLVVIGVALGIFAFRPPHIMHYSLSSEGLQINDKQYKLGEFRGFGIVNDGPLYSVMLIPIKRFMPTITLYFEEKDGEKIVDILGVWLPMQRLEQDFIDKLLRKLRF